MDLIYIGPEFYFESGTIMSSLYEIEGNRQDWGFVQVALRKGESVHIRPATEEEKKPFRKYLQTLRTKIAGGSTEKENVEIENEVCQ